MAGLQEQKDVQVLNMSSKWALADHLEYCSDDKLSELDNYEENKDAGKAPHAHCPASVFRMGCELSWPMSFVCAGGVGASRGRSYEPLNLLAAWQLFFLAINPDHFPIESYDAFGEDYYDTDNTGYWGQDGHHAIKVNDQ